MESALIVSESEKGTAFFKEFLSQNFCKDIVSVRDGESAKRMLIERDFDLCMVDTPLRMEFGERLSIQIAEKNICQVLLVVKAEIEGELAEKVEDFGIITVAKPVNKALLWNALKLANAAQHRILRMHKENDKLMQTIEDIKLVNRAKCVLISYLGMTEEEAHKQIERQAMDMRLTRREIAENILRTYNRNTS